MPRATTAQAVPNLAVVTPVDHRFGRRQASESVRAFREQGSPELVELCSRYSNRDDLLEPLVSVLEQINNSTPTSEPEDQLISADGSTPKAWRVADRLSPADLANLIDSYRAGNTVRDLAERFNLGTTTVKRLLKEHKARRKDQRVEPA